MALEIYRTDIYQQLLEEANAIRQHEETKGGPQRKLTSVEYKTWINCVRILHERMSPDIPVKNRLGLLLNKSECTLEMFNEITGIVGAIRKCEILLADKEYQKMKTRVFNECDVFLSHANKDKLDYVNELYESLYKLGINVFYDKKDLSWGDNWKEKILKGAEKSEFSIIVISNNYFDREWTEKELNEFLQRQNESGQKIILPLLYNINFEDMKKHYPELEFIQSIKASDYSKDEIAIFLAKELIKRYKLCV